ncbi:hypothetical protein RIR_jg22916.t1 [Rhizophagus irregularis DAOM 181602=DAOM 197198]|nr:hypothetical protein RIR_jg22916.t1 [Rhizophagus irregularis DAOM 181602=DAOM 197198]
MKVLKNIPKDLEQLEPILGYQVRGLNPENLNDAIDKARKKEAKSKLLRKTIGLNIGQIGQKKSMEDILKEEMNKYKKVKKNQGRSYGGNNQVNGGNNRKPYRESN